MDRVGVEQEDKNLLRGQVDSNSVQAMYERDVVSRKSQSSI